MLGTADTLLVGLRQDVEAQGLGEDRRDNLRRLAASEISTLPLMRDLMVFDAQGYRLINSGRPAPAIENVSDREYFQYHAAHPDRGVHFGNPVHGKLDGTWIITLSRRIDDPTGAFEGVVVATFAVGSIGDFYETFDVGKTGFLGIYTLGGVIITRHPGKQHKRATTSRPAVSSHNNCPPLQWETGILYRPSTASTIWAVTVRCSLFHWWWWSGAVSTNSSCHGGLTR